ncbi:hypothetical protein ACUN3E_38015 [Streptomyces sp. Ju416(a)]|uniref:hypothetical protein n=1 Tax=Streptomyces sp. Ju416(a) TaxID=3446591 RepID=UPI00403E1A74
MTTQTAWPENVIARYLTVAGSSLGRNDIAVDITHDTLTADDTKPNVTYAKCSGCSAYNNAEWASRADRWDNGSTWADSDARTWAQSHAETCRAIPKPA